MSPTITHPIPAAPAAGFVYELAQSEVWTNYEGLTVPIRQLGADHSWNILSHCLRYSGELVGDASRRLDPDGPLPCDVDRKAARFLHKLIGKVPPAQWVQATPAWREVVWHLVAIGELADMSTAVREVALRAERRGLPWEIAALRLALGTPPRPIRP